MAASTSASANRESNRIKEGDKRRVLDEATRRRRQRKALEALEADNYHEDPHADLVMSKKVPKFEDNLDNRARGKKKAKSAEYFKQKYRKTLQQLIDEDKAQHSDPPNYSTAVVGPSQLPERHFCSVCGFFSKYTCVPCGARYCTLKCLNTHLDTRCLKWTA